MYLLRRNNLDSYPRLMDHFFEDFWNTPAAKDFEKDSVVWTPKIDVNETKEAYEVLADMPGLNKEDIKVSLNDNVVTLKGERKQEVQKEDENTYHSERSYGNFCRSFELPVKVDNNKIVAEYKNGVLHLTLPKAEEAKPREIQIK